MYNQKQDIKSELTQLFYKFIDAGLHGRFEEALSLMTEGYMGVGMGEQGIVHSKEEAVHILKDGYIPSDKTKIIFEVNDFTINLLSSDTAVLFGEVVVTSTTIGGEPLRSGLVQTINACRKSTGWQIAFTHASPTILTQESIKAYPIRFLDQTLSSLRADLQAKSALQLDSLTGILNREGLENRAAELMSQYNPKHNTALFMIDLDDFKQINDRLGHQTGDKALQQVAAALKKTFREYDAVGRIGGDEFMVILTGDFSAGFLQDKAERLLNAVMLRTVDNHEISVSISVGIAYGRARATFEKLYRIADIALYTAKKAGKARYHLINSDTNAHYSHSGSGKSLLSLQTLLDYTDGKEILESKTPYEALLENIPGGVVMYEFTETTIKVNHCNEWFSRLIGYREDEIDALQAENPLVFVHPDDLQMMLKSAQSIRDGDDGNSVIYRVCHRDGSCSHINQITSVIERRMGSIIVYGIESDVDEVVRLKQDVEDSQRELEALIKNVPGGVALYIFTDTGIKSFHRNSWFSNYLGYTEKEVEALQEDNPLIVCHPDDLDYVEAAAQSIRDGANSNSIVYRVRHKNGSYMHMAQTISVISRQPGNIVMYGIETDVEETYRLKQQMEDSKKELEMLLNTIPGGVLGISITDKVRLIHRNQWMSRFLGYSQQELDVIEQNNALALVHPDDMPLMNKAIKTLRSGAGEVTVIYRLLGKDGSYRRVRISASSTQCLPDTLPYYAVITDVGETADIQS